MKRLISIFAVLAGCATGVSGATPAALTTLHAIHSLSNADAAQTLPVAFEATVTYFRSYESTLFVEDNGEAMYVRAPAGLKLLPGDRILVRGTTYADFRPNVIGSDIALLHHGSMPAPVAATFQEMIEAKLDCRYVMVRGVIRSADVELSAGRPVTQLELSMQGAYVGVTMDNGDPARLKDWLDAEVEVKGVAAGRFDGKMQQAGILIHSSSYSEVRVLEKAAEDPWSIPVTPMGKVLTAYDVDDYSRRVRVEGTITYYHQGQMAVLQDGSRSIRVLTPEIDRLRVGDRAEAIGIPYVDNGFLTIKLGAIRSTGAAAPIEPSPVNWDMLVSGKHAFDLVSIEGVVVSQVREQAQDVYIVSSAGNLFSATVRHPFVYKWGVVMPPPPMPEIAPGSKVRVTGVAILDEGNPFNGAMGFGILLRSADDVAVIARPSWLNVRHLVILVSLLLAGIFALGAWGWYVEREMRRQTISLAYVEQRRSRILEAMNASRPLAGILEEITELVSFKLNGAPCWCETADGAKLGNRPPETSASTQSILECAITAPCGQALGTLFAAICVGPQFRAEAMQALKMAAGLATLAIENSRLHSDLVHRSQFDMLTDIENRFSLERGLDTLLVEARQSAGVFGLIYIDLNEFKQVNDRYGHQVGDLYLQQAAERMKRQLRPGDTLARLGGDEFAALVPEVGCRATVKEIALRLESCFDNPFALKGNLVHGSASIGIAIYPGDATTKDGLLSAADAAMYAAKHARRQFAPAPAGEPKPEAVSQGSR
ncbi:MAG: GGDEF domain-containing protein [Terracidiphilus sp.]